jgi:hypothetical protein
VVELSAIPALIMMPRKPIIWPFRDFSIGNESINARIAIRIRKKDIPVYVRFPSEVVDLSFLKIHELRNKRITRISKIIVGSSKDPKILKTFSISKTVYYILKYGLKVGISGKNSGISWVIL